MSRDRDEHMNRLMRDLLIEHIDQKPLPIRDYMQLPPDQRDGPALRHNTLMAAWRRAYISFDRYPCPRTSIITQLGRQMLARTLADWADALTRAVWAHADHLAEQEAARQEAETAGMVQSS